MDSNFKSFPPADDTPDLDLYTIPSTSSWFSWDSIHEIERSALREFFDASSYSRSPKIYKEYRDFIISKYREDPSRRLTFTEVRKSLVGDISLIRKVFSFLKSWGLINFNASSSTAAPAVEEEAEDHARLREEDGPPIGVKVVSAPNSVKPMPVPPLPAAVVVGRGGRAGGGALGDGNGFIFPPLASYSDVFVDLAKSEAAKSGGFVCANCKEKCESKYYDCAKDKSVICMKCFEKGEYGEGKATEDFKLNECTTKNGDLGTQWSEAETLLLLESVLKHGDDWDLVAQSVHTKTKSECISRLIEMPFGELMLGVHGKVSSRGIVNVTSTAEDVKPAKEEPQETGKAEDDSHEQTINKENGKETAEENQESQDQGPTTKKRRVDSSPPDRSLMKQVALISDVVGPRVKVAAIGGAVSAVCNGNPLLEQIFYADDAGSARGLSSGNQNMEIDRPSRSEGLEMKLIPGPSASDETLSAKDGIPLPLRMRAAVATALGTAAARAKLMADQEEREMEFLVASLIETQMKKLHSKVKHFEDLECIMEKEYAELEKLKESVVGERMNILKQIIDSGLSKWRDNNPVKS